jgi:HK97 family phage major capsid protein
MGVRVFQTNLKVVDLPAESTSLTKFTRVAESGSYSTNDPAFAQNQVTVQKWTKLTKFSEEILEDNAAGLLDYYTRGLARAMAATEAYYVAIGSGTNQHEGIFEGGDTDAFIYNTDNGMDSDSAYIVGSAVWAHYYDLPEGYRTDAAWLMDSQTLAEIVSARSTKAFEWGGADLLTVDPGSGQVRLIGKPVFTQDDISTNASAVGFIAFGSPFYYTLVERKGLSVMRNPYLYNATGEIGFFTSFRQSGKVTVEEAWNIGVGA